MKQEMVTEDVKVKQEPEKKVDPVVFEQYKIMVATTSEVTKNRQTTNSFYLALNTFLLGAVSILQNIPQYGTMLLCLVGMAVSSFWYVNIQSYRNLNRAKFLVIHELEKEMPKQIFTDEEKAYKSFQHISFTSIEKYIPVAFGILYAIILAYKIVGQFV